MLYFHELEVNCSELFHHFSICMCIPINYLFRYFNRYYNFELYSSVFLLILFCTSFSSSDVIDKGLSSAVTSSEHPELTMSLQLLGGDSTFNQPEQHWQFESNVAVIVFLVEKS